MVFDDNFFQLTGTEKKNDVNNTGWSVPIDEEPVEEAIEETVEEKKLDSSFSFSLNGDISESNSYEKWSSELGNPEQDYVIESDLVVPVIRPQKSSSTNPRVVVIDDDFDTLDLMKIYLARGYDYVSFSGPKEAIFYLNENIPNLIILDSSIHSIKAPKVIDIIRSYKDLKNVPIVYTCDESEKSLVVQNLPEEVSGVLTRPVSRGNLQYILDKFLPKK